MRDINRRYQIDHDSNEMWIAENLWEEREDGRVQYRHGLCPLDVDEGIVEQAKFMSIHIILKAQLHNESACRLKQTFLIKQHHRSDGDTLPTDEPPGEFQDMLTKFKCLFGEPTYANWKKGRQANFEIKTDLNGKIPFRSPYCISPHEEEVLRRETDKAIRWGWLQSSRGNFGSPVFFVPKPDSMLRMCIDYRAVNPITIKNRYPLPHIEDVLNSMHSSCWFPKLDLAAAYHQICIATSDRQKTAFTTKFGLYE